VTLCPTAALNGLVSLLDIPCGDANWQFESWELDSLPVYVGADVVTDVIDLNKRKFSFHSNKLFTLWDIANCQLPMFQFVGTAHTRAFDLVHVRDLIQHLPLVKGVQVTNNIRNSGITYLIATTWPEGKNTEIVEGDFFKSNLAVAPFMMPPPLKCISTHPDHEADMTCLYKLQD